MFGYKLCGFSHYSAPQFYFQTMMVQIHLIIEALEKALFLPKVLIFLLFLYSNICCG